MADVVDAKITDTDNLKPADASILEPEVEEAVVSKIDSEEVKTTAEDVKTADTEVKEVKEAEDDLKEDTTISPSKFSGQKRKNGPHPPSSNDRNQRKKIADDGPRYNANIVSRFDDQPESNEADEIRRQVEFYFSDSNLPIDSYLLSLTRGHENHGVDLKVLHNFKRMQHFQPYSAVRDAVLQSKVLNLNDKDEVTRKVPLSDRFTSDPLHNRTLVHTNSMTRSIYAKGFGDEVRSTHLDIETFFDPYGPIKCVRLRRTNDGAFKGSVFVEFEDDEGQQRFLELDPKPQWGGKDLEIMSKQDYVDVKHKGIMDGIVKPKSPREFGGKPYRYNDRRQDDRDRRGSKGYHGDRNGRGGKDRYDRDDWKARREHDQRSGGRGGYRGRDRGGRGGGYRKDDRNGGRGRRDSPEDRYSKRRRSDSESSADSRHPLDRTPPPKRRRSGDGDSKEDEDRIAAEPMTVKTDEDARENGGDASAGAVEVETNGDGAKAESKKRALEDEDEGQGEGKKLKAVEVS